MRTLRAFVLTLAVTLSLAAQSLSPIFSTTDQSVFNAAYKASLPAELLAFMALPYNSADAGATASGPMRTTPSVLLAIANKYPLDTQIMLWGWDPYTTDLVRIVQGYGWVPSFGQPNIAVGPGISPALVSTGSAYDAAAPPAGSIRMPAILSTGKMALPPPYAPPLVHLPPAPTADPVGFLEMPFGEANGVGDWYSVITGDTSPVGTVSIDARGVFQKSYKGFANVAQPGVVSIFWVKVK